MELRKTGNYKKPISTSSRAAELATSKAPVIKPAKEKSVKKEAEKS